MEQAAQYYHAELARFAFVLGIVVSLLFYERRHLTTGGIAVPGYLAFGIFQPLIVPGVFLAALMSHLVVHRGLARIIIISKAAKFSLTILMSAGIHLLLDAALITFASVEVSSPLLRGIGYVVPGLIAHDFSRHGIWNTSFNIGIASSLVALALITIVSIFPELARLEVSPVMDPFPVALAYLPLLIFLSLIAWLGIVRVHGLRCGGFLGGAYFTVLVMQPEELIRFAAAAFMTLIIVRVFLDPIAILFGRRRFAAFMLIGACLSWAAFRVSELYFAGQTISAITPSLAVVGVLLTGLLASDMDRVGIGWTLLGTWLSVAFTLTGTLLAVEIATFQRASVAGPLLILFLTGSALMATRPEHLRKLGFVLSGRSQTKGGKKNV